MFGRDIIIRKSDGSFGNFFYFVGKGDPDTFQNAIFLTTGALEM